MRYRPLLSLAPEHDGPPRDAFTAPEVEGGDRKVSEVLHLEVLRLDARARPALAERIEQTAEPQQGRFLPLDSPHRKRRGREEEGDILREQGIEARPVERVEGRDEGLDRRFRPRRS
jgi:hypothetical protein